MTDDKILATLHNQEDIPLENAMEVTESPLQEPESGVTTIEVHPLGEEPNPSLEPGNLPEGNATNHVDTSEPLDVPEQHIDETAHQEPPPPQLPMDQALLAADALLSTADNFLAIGAGFFVKINKHEDFLDFEEVVQVIDDQNEANVQRMRLSPAEKDMLRPLLAVVIQKRALNISPEKQLIGVAASILISKVQVMFMIRKENAMLTDRIRMIVREEVRQAEEELYEEEEAHAPEPEPPAPMKQKETPPPAAATAPMDHEQAAATPFANPITTAPTAQEEVNPS